MTADRELVGRSDSTPEEIVDLYDEWAADGYDDDVERWGYDAPERVAAMIAETIPSDGSTDPEASGPVLDAGCGTGRVGVALAELGVSDIVGGDVTEVSLDAARGRGVYHEVVHLDLNAPLPYDDEHFAAAASVGVFTYVTDMGGSFRELLRVVRSGGTVIVTQRSDLWEQRNGPRVVASLVSDGLCEASVSDVEPYLPGHPEFSDAVGIRYVTLVRR